MKIKFLSGVLLSSAFLFLFVLGTQGSFLSKAFINSNQSASVISSKQKENIYNISPSKEFPGAFNFNYVFEKKSSSSKEANFDLPIAQFDQTKAGNLTDFGPIRDAWGYPVKENAFMKKEQPRKQSFLESLKTNKAVAYDEDTSTPGVYNCRANISVTGYFKAYFEDVVLNTNVGFDDPSYGDGRREEACQVLEDISELLMIDNTAVTPDILFSRGDQDLNPGALAGASSYFGYYAAGPDNGSLHKHIISRQDPTPGSGNFDAFVITNWSGINWSIDSNLNQNTYDFYTVMWHEMMHALGFRTLLPAVISQTGVEHRHGTFDHHTYKDESLQNRFITAITNLLNVPVGAPSPWFITNQVVYRGVKNILNATPDGIRPIYSPTSWQQGSSLSHFDMSRSGGEEYVMHQSITTNTEREIHEHELEVLCHLGYQVDGVEECGDSTPVAVDDNVDLNGPEPVCVDLLNNDINPEGSINQLRVNTFEIVASESGDVIQYFSNTNCSNEIQTFSGASSIRLIPTIDQSTRIFEYTNNNLTTGRISFPATISFELCTSDPDEYICNGDFEYGAYPAPGGQLGYSCPSEISFWCLLHPTPDVYSRDYDFYNWIGLGVNGTYSPSPNDRYFRTFNGMADELYWSESFFNELRNPLIADTYSLSFYGVHYKIYSIPSNPIVEVIFTNTQPSQVFPPNQYVPLPTDFILNIPVTTTDMVPNDASQWNQYSANFEIPDNGIEYRYMIINPKHSYADINISDSYGQDFFDGLSLKRVFLGTNILSGHLYQDQNQNSSAESSEPRLPGVEVGLFQSGNNTPIQTTTTQDLPNLGKYEFTNLPDGEYYIGLIGENLYQSVTEPEVSTDPFTNYNHMQTAILEDGQTIQNLDFGVTLQTGVPQTTNITIKKDLIDSSLSVFDRFVTWRIRVFNSGPSVATNINISDFLPAGITYFSYNNQNELEIYSPNSGIYYIPELSPGEATYIDITTKVPIKTCGAKVNTASLESLDQTDVSSVDNQASATLSLKPCFPTAVEGRF